MDESTSYLLQVMRLGMFLADPNELDGVEPWHFGDPVVRDVVSELKERRKTVTDGGKLRNGPTLLSALLVEMGCDEGIGSVEDAKSAIRDRVELTGRFVRVTEFLSGLIQAHHEKRNLSNYELRRFCENVERGMNPT